MRTKHTSLQKSKQPKKTFLLAIAFSQLFLLGCLNSKKDVNLSGIEVNPKYYRLDKDLFAVNHDSVWDYVPKLKEKYGSFFEVYNNFIIKIGSTNQFNYDEKLVNFLTDPYIENTQQDVQKLFPNLYFKNDLNLAFKRTKFYFPDKQTPNIYTHISGFNQSIIVDSGYMSISLDKYLGCDSKFYSMLRTPYFLRQKMEPNKIISDVIFSYLTSEFELNTNNPVLLDRMIYYGKIQYAMDLILPNCADSLKWGMPEEKLNWCEKNERKMWLYLVENKLLFSSDEQTIRRFIDDGPFTAAFSKQSPARTGQWIGYKIVKNYVKNSSDTNLEKLMNIRTSQDILNQSKYKP